MRSSSTLSSLVAFSMLTSVGCVAATAPTDSDGAGGKGDGAYGSDDGSRIDLDCRTEGGCLVDVTWSGYRFAHFDPPQRVQRAPDEEDDGNEAVLWVPQGRSSTTVSAPTAGYYAGCPRREGERGCDYRVYDVTYEVTEVPCKSDRGSVRAEEDRFVWEPSLSNPYSAVARAEFDVETDRLGWDGTLSVSAPLGARYALGLSYVEDVSASTRDGTIYDEHGRGGSRSHDGSSPYLVYRWEFDGDIEVDFDYSGNWGDSEGRIEVQLQPLDVVPECGRVVVSVSR